MALLLKAGQAPTRQPLQPLQPLWEPMGADMLAETRGLGQKTTLMVYKMKTTIT